MQITPASLNFLFNEFSTLYQKAFSKYQPRYQALAEKVPSSTKLNTYGWMGELPGFREWVGPRLFHNIAARSYSLINKSWENSFALPREDIEDDTYGLFKGAPAKLGKNAARLWDNLVFDALMAGAANVCYDGQFFFDTDHPINVDDGGSSGTYANLYSSTPITVANVNAMIAAMMAIKDDVGNSRELSPNVMFVPPERAAEAFAAVKAPVYGSGGVAVPNPVQAAAITGRPIDVQVIPRLSKEPNIWYLADTEDMKPIVLQVRKEAEFVSRTAPDMDNVFYRREYEYGADARGVAGYGLPFTCFRISIA